MFKKMIPMVILILAGLTGCADENPFAPLPGEDQGLQATSQKSGEVIFQDNGTPPPDLVSITVGTADLVFWPFTGSSFGGEGVDPINLIFTGRADPRQIREALLSLDGDRSCLGLPPVFPFDQCWHDALGGSVQTGYETESGWSGSVIQLTLGAYEPVRFHLRLFRTGATTADGQPVTLGAAHFEVLITGTSEHQVLSWELAEQVVTGDLMRCGLLDPLQHIGQTGQINPAPSWRFIDPAIYNELPEDLLALIQGPEQPQSTPVPIATDGCATTVHLADALPIQPLDYATSATLEFGQFIPRPFCSTGPFDWLHITGGVEFTTSVTVDQAGRFSYQGGYEGTIIATPVDIMTGEPVGEPFSADVRGSQLGWLNDGAAQITANDRKLSHEPDGAQINVISLRISETGSSIYKEFNKCLID